jgi:hypothetical protein
MAGRAKARANQPEGDIYEVEYFLGTRLEQQGDPATESPEESTVLFRRLWPNPDKDRTPGGILTPIAENIGLFQVRFYDGKQWGDEWTEEMRSLPEYMEVTLATLPPERGDPLVETFVVTFPRLSRSVPTASQQTEAPQGEQSNAGPDASAPTGAPSGSSSGSSPGSISGSGSQPSAPGRGSRR